MGLQLQKAEEQRTLVGVKEYFAIAGMSVGRPFLDNEIAKRSIWLIQFRADTMLVEVEGQLQLFVDDEVLVHLRTIIPCDGHVKWCPAVLPILGYLRLGLGIRLANILNLHILRGLCSCSTDAHEQKKKSRFQSIIPHG